MFKSSTRSTSGQVLWMSLLATLGLAAASAFADETYVLDGSAGTNGSGALYRLDAASGARTLVSNFGNAAQGPLGLDPFNMAQEAGGTFLVIDGTAGTGGRGALFRVDRVSGNRTLVSDFGNAAKGPLGLDPSDLALEATGTLLVIDFNAGTGNAGALFRVDAATGNRTLVSDFGNGVQGMLGSDPFGLALEAAGTVLVIDFSAGTDFRGALFRVDRVSGNRNLVSLLASGNQGPLGESPFDLAVEAAGTVLIADRSAGATHNGALFRVDAASGFRGLVSDFASAAQGPLGRTPFGLTLEAAGTVLVIDDEAGTNNAGALFRVDRLTGRRTLVSDFGNAAQGALGVHPSSVAVILPNCEGRVPTVVGDNGNNVLIGSQDDDVILGRGGDDLVEGRGGNDLICGGDGNDVLRGGSEHDGVEGGAGADTVEGGPGDDRLDGGVGTDFAAGGTGRDRCENAEVKIGCEL